MDNTVCPHCGAPLKHDANGKIVYLRSYTCGSYGNLAIESEFTQSVSCMQAQIKRLQRINGELLDRQYDFGKQIVTLETNLRATQEQLKGELSNLAWHKSLCNSLVQRLNTLREQRNRARIRVVELEQKIKGICNAVGDYLTYA